jgi:hypothetical protein
MADQTTTDGVLISSTPLLGLAVEWENDARKLYDCADTAAHVLERAALRGAAARVQRMADRLRIVVKANAAGQIPAAKDEHMNDKDATLAAGSSPAACWPWQCYRCGRLNPNRATACPCGVKT